MFVQEWLDGIPLAPKTKGKIKALMHRLFEKAMFWELIPVGRNPMALVEIQGASKRRKKPIILTVEQYFAVLGLLPEPYRTMAVVAQCLGLRVSEILALQWRGRWSCRRGQDRVFRGRTSARSRSRDCLAELERAMSKIGSRLDVSQPHHQSLLPRQSNPARLCSSGWTKARPRRHRLAHLPPHVSVLARLGWHFDGCAAEADAARSNCNHHECLRRRHDGIEARSQQ